MNPEDDPADAAIARALAASRALEDAPEHVIQRAIDLFAPAAGVVPASRRGLLPRLLAALSFDSATASPLAFGMRGDAGPVRQLLFSIDGRDIDLRVAAAPAPGRFVLSGQILGPDSAGVVVLEPIDPAAAPAAAPATGDAEAVTLDDLGAFELPPVGAGLYRVTLELADVAIELPPVRVPQSA